MDACEPSAMFCVLRRRRRRRFCGCWWAVRVSFMSTAASLATPWSSPPSMPQVRLYPALSCVLDQSGSPQLAAHCSLCPWWHLLSLAHCAMHLSVLWICRAAPCHALSSRHIICTKQGVESGNQ